MPLMQNQKKQAVKSFLHRSILAVGRGFARELRQYVPYLPSIILYVILAGFGYDNGLTVIALLLLGVLLSHKLNPLLPNIREEQNRIFKDAPIQKSSGNIIPLGDLAWAVGLSATSIICINIFFSDTMANWNKVVTPSSNVRPRRHALGDLPENPSESNLIGHRYSIVF